MGSPPTRSTFGQHQVIIAGATRPGQWMGSARRAVSLQERSRVPAAAPTPTGSPHMPLTTVGSGAGLLAVEHTFTGPPGIKEKLGNPPVSQTRPQTQAYGCLAVFCSTICTALRPQSDAPGRGGLENSPLRFKAPPQLQRQEASKPRRSDGSAAIPTTTPSEWQYHPMPKPWSWRPSTPTYSVCRGNVSLM